MKYDLSTIPANLHAENMLGRLIEASKPAATTRLFGVPLVSDTLEGIKSFFTRLLGEGGPHCFWLDLFSVVSRTLYKLGIGFIEKTLFFPHGFNAFPGGFQAEFTYDFLFADLPSQSPPSQPVFFVTPQLPVTPMEHGVLGDGNFHQIGFLVRSSHVFWDNVVSVKHTK